VPVFCQKPLARTGAETREVIEAARNRDRLLAVDFSYRPALAFERVIAAVREERLGRVYSVDLVFHNAYGPDKGWSKDRTLAGGGCLIDLGVHLLDMAMLALGAPRVSKVHAALFASGEPLRTLGEIEDFAQASFETETGANVRIACSWWLHAGQDAIIEAIFRGTQGAATVHNVNGSFFDFVAELSRGTSREVLASPPDDWEARAVKAWAGRLARSNTFDPSVESAAVVAELIDRIYAA
jgi:predicted dehydrogenase